MLTGVNLSPTFAFVGKYAVKEKYRGKGIGQAMWQKMMQHIGDQRNISLFAAEEMFPIYRDKLGFCLVPEKHILFFDGIPKCDELVSKVDNISVLKVNEDNIEQVISYDQQVCDGMNRRVFLTESMKIKEYFFLVAQEGGEVKGYCLAVTSN